MDALYDTQRRPRPRRKLEPTSLFPVAAASIKILGDNGTHHKETIGDSSRRAQVEVHPVEEGPGAGAGAGAGAGTGGPVDARALKKTIKKWEKEFEAAHGRKPGKEDAPPEMVAKYKLYRSLKRVEFEGQNIAGHEATAANNPSSSPREPSRIDEPAAKKAKLGDCSPGPAAASPHGVTSVGTLFSSPTSSKTTAGADGPSLGGEGGSLEHGTTPPHRPRRTSATEISPGAAGRASYFMRLKNTGSPDGDGSPRTPEPRRLHRTSSENLGRQQKEFPVPCLQIPGPAYGRRASLGNNPGDYPPLSSKRSTTSYGSREDHSKRNNEGICRRCKDQALPFRFYFSEDFGSENGFSQGSSSSPNNFYSHFDVLLDAPIMKADHDHYVLEGDVPSELHTAYHRMWYSRKHLLGWAEITHGSQLSSRGLRHTRDNIHGTEQASVEAKMGLSNFCDYVCRIFPRSARDVEPLMVLHRGLNKHLLLQLDHMKQHALDEARAEVKEEVEGQGRRIEELEGQVKELTHSILDAQRRHMRALHEKQQHIDVLTSEKDYIQELKRDLEDEAQRLSALRETMVGREGMAANLSSQLHRMGSKLAEQKSKSDIEITNLKTEASMAKAAQMRAMQEAAAARDELAELQEQLDFEQANKEIEVSIPIIENVIGSCRGCAVNEEVVRVAEGRVEIAMAEDLAQIVMDCWWEGELPELPEVALAPMEAVGFVAKLDEKMVNNALRLRIESELHRMGAQISALKGTTKPAITTVTVVAAVYAMLDFNRLPPGLDKPGAVTEASKKGYWNLVKSLLDGVDFDPKVNTVERMKRAAPQNQSQRSKARMEVVAALLESIPYTAATRVSVVLGLMHQWLSAMVLLHKINKEEAPPPKKKVQLPPGALKPWMTSQRPAVPGSFMPPAPIEHVEPSSYVLDIFENAMLRGVGGAEFHGASGGSRGVSSGAGRKVLSSIYEDSWARLHVQMDKGTPGVGLESNGLEPHGQAVMA